ncbi:D-alanyl-D-alanine carboxypeptidase/D-alanyl-D-alanine-endopeptidase [Bacteroides mediterraneensis]|nr:D-alanyl-D-alanine carboxypeptidase/D-alanyl-D-alanine-endopeptidase [Bacteroides mediterraneensis]
MKQINGLLFLLIFWTGVLQAQNTCREELDRLISSDPLLKISEVGIVVHDLTTGKELYSYQADKLYRPASIEKVVTAVTALKLLGEDYLFQTRLSYEGVIEKGVLQGNLCVTGGFDPEFMELDMDFLVRAVKNAGIETVSGQLVGDVTLMDSLYWGAGWSWDDTPESFQPYLSPLMLNRGCVDIKVTPATKGQAGNVKITPESDYYQVDNRSVSLHPDAGRLKITRDWLTNGNTIKISGCVSSARGRTLNLYDSKRFFMETFRYKLEKEGISVAKDSISFRGVTAQAHALYSCRRPLDIVMKRALKESDNLSAEALFRQLGRVGGKDTLHVSFETCQKVVGDFMQHSLGYDPKNYQIVDGSGVSLYNYVSPRLILAYLNYAYRHPALFRIFYDCLPVAGVDGTLRGRMRKGKAFRNVRAKTGTVTGICSLAGYLTSVNGHKISFVIINQNVLKARPARMFQDKVCELLVNMN